mgnify:CR=1 FL=1
MQVGEAVTTTKSKISLQMTQQETEARVFKSLRITGQTQSGAFGSGARQTQARAFCWTFGFQHNRIESKANKQGPYCNQSYYFTHLLPQK